MSLGKTIALPTLTFIVLGACGGSGGSGGVNNLAEFEDLVLDAAAAGPTDPGDMPTSGSASYAGFANIGVNPGAADPFQAAAVGELSLDVDFGGGSDVLSGSIRNFQYLDESGVSGSMSIDGGTITGNQLAGATANGTVAGFDMDMTIDGDFEGTRGELLSLFFDGTSTKGSTVQNTGGVGIALDP